MPLGYNSSNAFDNAGGEPKSRGLRYREEQLAAAKQERAEYAREGGGPGVTGNVSTREDVARKERALRRQQQYAAGQYPSGQ